MKASENETIAEIVKEIRQVGPYAVYKKPIFKDVTAVSESFVKRFMYGHFVTDFGTVRIENPKVKEVSNYELADRIEAAHRREIAELRECLNRRSKYINTILQKALELGKSVPLELREIMDDCIVAEDKAIGLGVFSKNGGDEK